MFFVMFLWIKYLIKLLIGIAILGLTISLYSTACIIEKIERIIGRQYLTHKIHQIIYAKDDDGTLSDLLQLSLNYFALSLITISIQSYIIINVIWFAMSLFSN